MRNAIIASSVATILAVSGCADMSETQRGTATGAGIGAAAGALLGAVTGGGGGDRAATGAALGGIAGAVAGNVWSSRMEKQKQAMQQATQGTGVQVSQTADNRLKLDIPSDVSFDVGRSAIKPNFAPVLNHFATSLNQNTVTTVTIIGHTDSTGSDAINNQPRCRCTTLQCLRARRTRAAGRQRHRGQPREESPRRDLRSPAAGHRARCTTLSMVSDNKKAGR